MPIYLLDSFKKVDCGLTLILSSHSDIFPLNFSDLNFSSVNEIKSPLVFLNKAVMESYPSLLQGDVSYLNHIGRVDDDYLYKASQNECRNIISRLENIPFFRIFEDVSDYAETSSLASGESLVLLIRTAIMIDEILRNKKISRLSILGVNVNLAMSLAILLESRGFAVDTYFTPSFIKRAKAYSENIEKFNVRDHVRLASGQIDPAQYALQMLALSKSSTALGILRAKDPVYLENVAEVLNCRSERFIVIDRFLDNEAVDSLREASGSTSFEFHQLTSKYSSLSRMQVIDLKEQLEKHFIDHDFDGFEVGGYSFGRETFFYIINIVLINILKSYSYYRIFSYYFERKNIKFVVVAPARSVEARMAISAAGDFDITSYDLQCGTINASARFWPPTANKILASEVVSAEIFVNFFRLNNDRIELIGSPRLDRNVRFLKEQFKSERFSNNKIIVVLQTIPILNTLNMLDEVILACKELNIPSISVSIHPRESVQSRVKIIQHLESAKIGFEVVEGPTLLAYVRHNVCITYFSFSAIEAFAIGLRVIPLNTSGSIEWPFRISRLLQGEEAYCKDDLVNLLSKPYSYDARSLNILNDGSAVVRLNALIDSDLVRRSHTLGRRRITPTTDLPAASNRVGVFPRKFVLPPIFKRLFRLFGRLIPFKIRFIIKHRLILRFFRY